MDHDTIYQPLPHAQRSIRLLSIAAGWPVDPIHVGLVTIQDIDDAPPYVALSYVWGLTHAADPIFCNGVPKRVTKSLGDALRAFRPLPSCEPEEAHRHGLGLLSADDACHSNRHIWRDIAHNKWEKSLESHTSNSLFWIDALCINQNDVDERSNQVKGMREIYQNARSVRIWLGSEISSVADEEAFQSMPSSWLDKFLGRARLADYGAMPVVLAFIAQAFYNSKEESTSHDESHIGFPPTHAPEWGVFRKFFQHPWFYRVWTVQEIAMAKHASIVVGDWELDWKAFALAVGYLYDTYHRYSLVWKSRAIWNLRMFDSSLTSLPLDSVSYMCRIRSGETERPLLMGLLQLGRNRGATQPVDYVFAVLNLSADWKTVNDGTTQVPYIEPDYTKSIARTFTDVTTWLVTFHRSLDVLSFVAFERQSPIPDCPSWVPVWSQQKRSCALAHGEYRWSPEYSTLQSPHRRLLRETGYNAAMKEPMLPCPFEDLMNTKILHASGLKLSPVVAVSEPLVPVGDDDITLRDEATAEERLFIESTWDLCEQLIVQNCMKTQTNATDQPEIERPEANVMDLTASYRTRDQVISALILTLCANRDEDWARADRSSETRHDAIAWLSKLLGTRFSRTTFGERTRNYFRQKGDQHAFQATMSLICSWRRFFVTESGHMGIGPVNTQNGDIATVLFGSTIPFMVKPLEGNPNRHLLLGECYVHGIMDGELVEHWRSYTSTPPDLIDFE
ncbi:hypothetical protein K505DRAFT_325083 [Melanomma pulvis-pyrius CBS 109.77]|uniref:Heterokaryon incompatibility domain-containing protein n=1 Tax=Melanomma pulvis-pyrius CBS 109.77 TaxID=1314802 RepID=A0A6A6XC18_9PLEO|nr:hypothetical protein K505DRAFT_325083 [Melanomma pulvis-pyrius CBS 109.77]